MNLRVMDDWSTRLADRLSLREARRWEARPAAFVHREKLVFIHIPKTGGTSFDAFLSTFFSAGEILPPRLQILGVQHWTDLDAARYRYLHGGLPFEEVRRIVDAHFVTFLRDPIARIVSEYWHLRRRPDLTDELPEKHRGRSVLRNLAQSLAFEEWVRLKPLEVRGAYSRNAYVGLLTRGHPHLARATPDEVRALRRQAEHVLAHECVFFGLLEDYPRSKQLFCRTFGLPGHFARGVERYNASTGLENRPPLDPETLALLRHENAADLQLYEYARRLFEERCALASAAAHDELDTVWVCPTPCAAAGTCGHLIITASELRGSGVHSEETCLSEAAPGGRWAHRWLGGDCNTQINLAANLPPGARLTIRLLVTEVASDEAWDQLAVTFDDLAPLPSRYPAWRSGPDGLEYCVQFRITDAVARRPIHVLSIDCPPAIPSELPGASTDTRALSIAVRELQLDWRPFPTAAEKLQLWVAKRWQRLQTNLRRAA